MSEALHSVVQELSAAMMAGKLDARGDSSLLTGRDAEIVRSINAMIDALVRPMRLAGNALEEIAHGKLPAFVIEEYQGEHNRIKQNINTLLAILYGMHGETVHLINSISEGKLKTRGNDWDYEGIWKTLISGMNAALDAVIAPITEAGAVLDRLAHYDLQARMKGKYRGDHASIRKTMNATAESLHEAIAQVSETVSLVSDVGRQITRISTSVTQGAEEQSVKLSEATANLARLSASARQDVDSTVTAHERARQASESIGQAKRSMDEMLASMQEIHHAADETATIAVEIDGIAKETETLSGDAVSTAARMLISVGGFEVVAQEIRRLSQQCADTANAMKSLQEKVGEEQKGDFERLIANLLRIARFSNLLGVNAAIEGAHVEDAGAEFKTMTDEINNLATRSTEAASKAGELTNASITLARKGVGLSRDIHQQLEEAVEAAHELSNFSDAISASISEETNGLERVARTATQINVVTQKNAENAAESLVVARNLEQQVGKLTKMVNRFRF